MAAVSFVDGVVVVVVVVRLYCLRLMYCHGCCSDVLPY
jgi:hypothetical protein